MNCLHGEGRRPKWAWSHQAGSESWLLSGQPCVDGPREVEAGCACVVPTSAGFRACRGLFGPVRRRAVDKKKTLAHFTKSLCKRQHQGTSSHFDEHSVGNGASMI